jgi:uncharacterized protein (DUF302 family)
MRTGIIAFEAFAPGSFDETVRRCREELARRGFGVLSEIDIQAKLQEKLGVELPPHLILGACHPPSAYRALQAKPEVGVLLPCNVTIAVEGGQTVVRAMNPQAAMQMLDSPEVAQVAEEVGRLLAEVVQAVEAG